MPKMLNKEDFISKSIKKHNDKYYLFESGQYIINLEKENFKTAIREEKIN